ncbi:hypothetical protein [Fluviicola sp.]|uniref:hypothetical protein n=1 Tax=Fluviicola sp. TaxID=1917219 RepID=UPI0031E3B49D
MKKLIYGISFLAIAGGAILVACNKQNLNPNQSPNAKTETAIDAEKSGAITSLFYRSVAILPKSHLVVNNGTEYVQQFSLLMFDESYVPSDSYILNNVDYTDDGKFNDVVAGDGVYTSVIKKPIASYVAVPANVALVSDDFEHFDEAASEFHISFKCKIRTTYEGYSAMGIPCSWGGCIEFYACKGEISFFD